MSKSIYDEALKHLNILNDFVINWCDEIDLNYHETYKNNYQKVKKAIELGKLYKEFYDELKPNVIKFVVDDYESSEYLDFETEDTTKCIELFNKIKELENE